MVLIAMQGRFTAWVNPRTFEYRFCGGKFGAHTIHCTRMLHGENGLFGRAGSHWAGYLAATIGSTS